MELFLDISDCKCLVTGSAKRLGKALVSAFAEKGADVIVHYRNSKKEAMDVVNSARGYRGSANAIRADLEEPAQAIRLVEDAIKAMDGLNVLINSASVFDRQGFIDTDLDTWNRNLAVNLTAPFVLSREFARHLISNGEKGIILNMLDWRALRPGRQDFAYTIAKSGLAAMTKGLAKILAPKIRVNGLALGPVLPPEGSGEKDYQRILEMVPKKRACTIEELVESALFLVAGPDYITGEILNLDGGRNLI
ncbi:MAG: SDR family oxidoreductase [Deltaproteobacteria bacterium]|nr:SDR family oxidoreductase [Deltaproteobacteria bacterium]